MDDKLDMNDTPGTNDMSDFPAAPEPQEEPMISVESVTKVYGPVTAVQDVSFTVRSGEIVGIVGPNGAGKSTMLKMLSTYIHPTMGRILVDGIDVVKRPLDVRRRIGYLSGDATLYQDMRVDKFILFVGRARGLKRSKLKESFDRVAESLGLEDVLRQRIRQCSTGFRQRVSLATALIHDPPVLLLDEPTHGFDPLQVRAFREFFKSLKAEKAILFSNHIISEVAAICDRVIFINESRILGQGTKEELAVQAGVPGGSLEDTFVELIQKCAPPQAEEEPQ